MRGVSAFIMVNHLNRFSNSFPSLIRITRDSNISFGQTLFLISLYPDPVRDPAGDLWRYFITLPLLLGYWSLSSAQSMLQV